MNTSSDPNGSIVNLCPGEEGTASEGFIVLAKRCDSFPVDPGTPPAEGHAGGWALFRQTFEVVARGAAHAERKALALSTPRAAMGLSRQGWAAQANCPTYATSPSLADLAGRVAANPAKIVAPEYQYGYVRQVGTVPSVGDATLPAEYFTVTFVRAFPFDTLANAQAVVAATYYNAPTPYAPLTVEQFMQRLSPDVDQGIPVSQFQWSAIPKAYMDAVAQEIPPVASSVPPTYADVDQAVTQ